MSLTVNLYYTGVNGAARAFAEEMEKSGLAAAIRAEDGNERYEYFFPMDDPETVLLIDRWRDQAALDRHHASLMMKSLAALRENTICTCAWSAMCPWRKRRATKRLSENDIKINRRVSSMSDEETRRPAFIFRRCGSGF